jgi:hypothetical protein
MTGFPSLPGGRIRRLTLAIIAALALALALAASATAVAMAAAPQARAQASCQHATGPFRVSGTQVTGAGGKVFIPYGITVPGLANYPNWSATESADLAKIRTTASSWCSNVARLQVSQDNLIGLNGGGYSQDFMNAIEREVSTAEGLSLVVVINDQTETDPSSVTYQKGPTQGTQTFWKDLIKVYGSDNQVIFDLFNEPRTYSAGMSQAQEWGLCHDGGTFDGANYIGMAKLASDLRAADPNNLFWVEGPDYSASFAGMERNNALLTTSEVVYAVHHPAGDHDPAAWYDDFGYLVNTSVAPVVDGEWTNFQPFASPGEPVKDVNTEECWTDAPTAVPGYLSYLSSHGIGMTGYQLSAGLLVGTDGSTPTTINATTWTCSVSTSGPTNNGAGAQILAWYRAHNS